MKGDHVHRQLPQIGVQLLREPEIGGHTGYSERHHASQVTIGWVGQLQSFEADVVPLH